VTPSRGMVNPILKSALEMGNRLGATPELHPLAEIIPTFPANPTLAAWNADLEGHSVTDVKPRDLRSNSHNGSRRLMPKR